MGGPRFYIERSGAAVIMKRLNIMTLVLCKAHLWNMTVISLSKLTEHYDISTSLVCTLHEVKDS